MVQLSKRRLAAWLVSGLWVAVAGMAISQAAPLGSVVRIAAKLSAASEVPPNTSSGTATLDGSFNKDSKILNYTLTYSGLSGPATAGHFHGPAGAGANAPVVLPFVDGLDSPIKGTAVLSDAQAADLLAGKWYVNLHTAAHAGGEIRGQVELN